MAEKRTLTVESQYCSNWTVEDAIRELVQNAIDTGTKIDIHRHDHSSWVIKDNGSGIQLSDFLIGRTSKADDSEAIGQFGEGAPIGCLVLARNGRDVKVYSKGKRYAFSFEYDNQWGSQLLTITIDDGPINRGTTVLVECSQEEMQNVQAKFLSLTPQIVLARTGDTEFLDCAGKVYVNGLEVSGISSIFGYNFKGHKHLVNRDRNAIGFQQIVDAVRRALETTTNRGIISRILIAGASGEPIDAVETGHTLYIKYPSAWKATIKEAMGTKVCLAEYSPSDLVAAEQNWEVLQLPYSLRYSLERSGVLKFSSSVINNGKEKEYILLRDLSPKQRESLREGKKVAEWLANMAGLRTYPIKIFQDLSRNEGTRRNVTLGCFNNGTVELEVGLLNYKETMIGVALHEYAHGTSGAQDHTREFENCLTSVIAKLGLECYKQANGKAG